MQQKPEKTVHSVLSKGAQLQSILAKVQALKKIETKIKQFLPNYLQAHYTVANYRDNCLILQTDNSAIATQLRYLSTDLLTKLRTQAGMPSIISIKINVREKI